MDGGTFNVDLSAKKGFIYVKNNGLKDSEIKTRALGNKMKLFEYEEAKYLMI